MKKSFLLIAGLIFLIVVEILKVYFIMPFPGSQQSDTINVAYFINKNIWWMRLVAIILIIFPLFFYLRNGKIWQKIVLIIVIIFYGIIAYAFNFKFLADKMFYQPKQKLFSNATSDTTDKNKLIIGVAIGSYAKAYPIEIIGYHHQIKDTILQQPIMVTYCTVCRTGRVYTPFVNGKYEQFRLVGMDHFNAMFEDATTKSWWRQETGTAITGPLKGTTLKEIPSAQMRLGDWLALHPNSLILQPDSNFKKEYADLKGYDEDTLKSSLERRDSASWKMKSWIIGIKINDKTKAYDWNDLAKKKFIQDSFAATPILLTLDKNEKTFYVLNRNVEGNILHFNYDANSQLKDAETNSVWNINGNCVNGKLKGKQLTSVQSYQEFWHSWKTFHPQTEVYK